MKKVEDGIVLLAGLIVAGRCVHVVVAMIADDGGLVEMMMNFAMRDIVCFPGERSGTGNMNYAGAVAEVGLDGVVGRVEVADAVHYEAVAVKIGSKGIRGETPHALIIFLHRRWLGGAFDGDGDFLGIGSAEAEGDAIVGVDFRRDDGWRLRLGVGVARRNQFGEKQSCEQQREAFHQVHLEDEICDNNGGRECYNTTTPRCIFAGWILSAESGRKLAQTFLDVGTRFPSKVAPALQKASATTAASE